MKKITKKIGVFILFTLIALHVSAQQDSVDIYDMDFESLMEMEVTVASKKAENINNAPGIITVMSREEIQNFDARNLGEVLNKLTSTMFISANYFSDNVVQMRGQSLTPYNNHVLVLLNGRPVRDPISGGLNSAIYTAFPVDMIERIEVIRGPGSVLYGSAAFSGVINIITLSTNGKDKSQASAQLAYGSYNEVKAAGAVNGKSGDLSYSLGVDFLKNDGPEYEFTDFSGVKDKANFSRETYGTVVSADYKGITANVSYLEFHPYALQGADVIWSHETAEVENKSISFMADVGYTHKFSEKISASLNLTYNRNNWTMLSGAQTVAEDRLGEFTLRAKPTDNFNIIFGGTLEEDHSLGGAALKAQRTMMGNVYTQLDYTFAEKIKLIGGIQANKIEHIDINLSPRLGVIANFNESLGVKLLYSTAFRRGYPWETSSSIPVFRGNIELKPELINTAEAQLFFKNEKAQFSVTAFYSQMQQIIIRNTYLTSEGNFDYLKYENGGSHNFYGTEIDGKVQVIENLFFTGSATYQTNESESGITDATLHPNIMVKAGLLYNTKVFTASVFNSYFGEPGRVSELNPDVAEVNGSPKAFSLLSAKLSFKPSALSGWKNDLRIFGEFYNILNQEVYYPEYTSKGVNSLLPLQKEFNFRIGVSVRLN